MTKCRDLVMLVVALLLAQMGLIYLGFGVYMYRPEQSKKFSWRMDDPLVVGPIMTVLGATGLWIYYKRRTKEEQADPAVDAPPKAPDLPV